MFTDVLVVAALTQATTDVVKTVPVLPPMTSVTKFAVALVVTFLIHLPVVGGVEWDVWFAAAATAHVLHVLVRLLGALSDRLRQQVLLDQRFAARRR